MRKLNVVQLTLSEVKRAVAGFYRIRCDSEEATFMKVEGCPHCEDKYTDSDRYEISWRKK